MAGKNVSKNGRLPGFFEDYGMDKGNGGITLTGKVSVNTGKKSGNAKSTSSGKKSSGKKK